MAGDEAASFQGYFDLSVSRRIVTPAKAGVQNSGRLDSGFRRNDGPVDYWTPMRLRIGAGKGLNESKVLLTPDCPFPPCK
jgi:hypothetical protein